MRMSLQQCVVQKQKQSIKLICRSSAFHSIFKRTEELLLSETDYQKALEFVGRRKHKEKYRDMIDFMFCELFPFWQHYCFLFYKDKGPRLEEYLSTRQIELYDSLMVEYALPTALSLLKEKYKVSWERFREETMELNQKGRNIIPLVFLEDVWKTLWNYPKSEAAFA